MRSPLLVFALLFVSVVSHAAAQTTTASRFEAGATLGSTCLIESSACGGGRHALNGVYGSFWVTPRVEIGGRVAMLKEPDTQAGADYFLGPAHEHVRIRFAVRERSRLYMLGQAYRHFGADPRARFFLGAAVGTYARRSTTTCETAECETNVARLGGPAAVGVQTGRQSRRRANVAFGFGLSGLAGPVGWRAGVNLHNFPGEHTGATELFAGAGVRF